MNIEQDFNDLRAAVYKCLEGGPRMREKIERPSGSVNGGTIIAARWWWILRGAMERTLEEHGKLDPTKARGVWEP